MTPAASRQRLALATGVGLAAVMLPVLPAAADTIDAQLRQLAYGHPSRLEEIIVTSTREGRLRQHLPESVGVLDQTALEQISPAHPAEALNRLAGVHINNLGGEGHMTAIRQPLTTGGVYLFLEDGIPTRPTGFFNHNGLYEIDLSQAERIEVTRGPGSALYGSDAIGGIINSITRAPGDERQLSATLEAGEDDWYRALISASGPAGERDRVGIQLNVTDNRSFRDDAQYERVSLTARWDRDWTPTLTSKTVLAWSKIDQSGVSALFERDYRNRPETNYFRADVGRREVESLRLSTEVAWQPNEQDLWTLTAFVRDNRMTLMPFWMLNYDPNVYTTDFTTFGLMGKYRRHFESLNLEWISGVDMDYTPSTYRERRIVLEQRGDLRVGYQHSGRTNYHYHADQLAISPYTQLEWQPVDSVRLTAGLRYDRFRIDYDDRLDASVPEVGVFPPQAFPSRHYRPDNQRVTFDQWSPKLGAVIDLHAHHNLYANYRHAFRAPTAGQLFRGGAVPDTTHLEPVTAVSTEIGVRGALTDWLDYDLALYHMTVEDDIVSLITDGTRRTVNSGETRHRGAELTLQAHFSEHWSAALAWSASEHEYRDFADICGTATCDFSGNALPRAPQDVGNVNVAYTGTDNRWRVELEWEYLGRYYTDEANSQRYGGHDLFNLRGHYHLNERWELFGRVHNLTDRHYATYVSNAVTSPDLEYRPGQPRTATVGVRFRL